MNTLNKRALSSLGIGLVLVLSLITVSGVWAAGSQQGRPAAKLIGLASDPIDCLKVGPGAGATASGEVQLAWSGQARRARLILTLAGTEGAHPIRVNGQPVGVTPVVAEGERCGEGAAFSIEIDPDLLVQGANRIEITSDGLAADQWQAAGIRLEVSGPIWPASIPDPAQLLQRQGQALAGSVVTIFPNTPQEFRQWTPDNYNSGTPTPLVVAVHPRNGTMFFGEDEFGVAADQKDWLMVSPQLHGDWPASSNPAHPSYPDPNPVGRYAYASLGSQATIIGAIQYMLANFNVDPNRIYIVGYSMGGQVATVTAAKYPHLFAAVFDNKAPTDMYAWYYEQVNYYGEGESKNHVVWMRRECHINEALKSPPNNPFCYRRRSSLTFAGNYRHLPISVTHSLQDELVPYSHSSNLVNAINNFRSGNFATLHTDTTPCTSPCHDYDPAAIDVLNYFDPHRRTGRPDTMHITTDQSKPYYWINISQGGSAGLTTVQATFSPSSKQVTAVISDTTAPLSVGFNLGQMAAQELVSLPGVGLTATTFQVTENDGVTVKVQTVKVPAGATYLTRTVTVPGPVTITIQPAWYRYLPLVTAN